MQNKALDKLYPTYSPRSSSVRYLRGITACMITVHCSTVHKNIVLSAIPSASNSNNNTNYIATFAFAFLFFPILAGSAGRGSPGVRGFALFVGRCTATKRACSTVSFAKRSL